jgi:hypothetical protein
MVRHKITFSLFLVVILTGCSLSSFNFLQPRVTPAGTIRPKFVNFPAPTVSMDLKPFTNAGCKPDPEGHVRCPTSLPPFDQVGCDEIIEASPVLGGMTPAVPLMLCLLEPTNPDTKIDPGEYLYTQGCSQTASYVRFVAFKDNKFQLVKKTSELKAIFAPIQNSEEALGYAMARTGHIPLFGLKDSNMRYLVNQIEDTHVVIGETSVIVNLYDLNICGCAPHAMTRYDVIVSPDGSLTVKDPPTPVWEDPTKDEICND